MSKVSTRSQFPFAPARLSPTLEALFPPEVVVAEMRETGDPSTLLPGEAEHIRRAVPKRVQEFAAGRQCARLALHSFGITDFELRVAADRQPVWPAGLVGSISHTTGLCIAVVADQACISAVGVDCEVVGHVNHEIWATICTETETAWLATLAPPQRAPAVALLFSAKEAIYKCQYPLTGEWLDFHDLEAQPEGFEPDRGQLSLRTTRALQIHSWSDARLGDATLAEQVLTVEYLFHEGFVTTGATLPRERRPTSAYRLAPDAPSRRA